ncbi:MAG TPA: hypothetical protein VFR03_19870 [Thermoanaerobaculia bacterium]|nr:hypothetical protein [Thermoanaerobaculia bacterium]
MNNKTSTPSLLPWAWTLLVVLLTATPLLAASYAQGERVQFTGAVSDPQGRPLTDVRVVLEATRTYFSVRNFRRTQTEEIRRVSAVTDASGQFTLQWPWDSYFNHFELVVGVPVRQARKERIEELAREDVTRRVDGGSPVVTSLVVQNATFVTKLREFVASVRSDDERKVYDDMGRPDKVERVQYPERTEVSWWYFDAGRVYRFRDGRLEQVVPFEPVKG